jgi:hypothetical protein
VDIFCLKLQQTKVPECAGLFSVIPVPKCEDEVRTKVKTNGKQGPASAFKPGGKTLALLLVDAVWCGRVALYARSITTFERRLEPPRPESKSAE